MRGFISLFCYCVGLFCFTSGNQVDKTWYLKPWDKIRGFKYIYQGTLIWENYQENNSNLLVACVAIKQKKVNESHTLIQVEKNISVQDDLARDEIST